MKQDYSMMLELQYRCLSLEHERIKPTSLNAHKIYQTKLRILQWTEIYEQLNQ